MRRSNAAFTLVELLVVISIIALLISLLLPALRKAKEVAQTVACTSNMRQVGIGFVMYRDDYRNHLPPLNAAKASSGKPWKTAKNYGMWNCIGPYTGLPEWGGRQGPPTSSNNPSRIKTDGYWGAWKERSKLSGTIWSCPANRRDAQPWFGGTISESLYLHKPVGWSTNTLSKGRPFWVLPSPSSKIHVSHSGGGAFHLGSSSQVGVRASTGAYAFDIYRHEQGTPILFADGHVQFHDADYIIENIVRSSSNPLKIFSLR